MRLSPSTSTKRVLWRIGSSSLTGDLSSTGSLKPSRERRWIACLSPVRNSQRPGAPNDSAYSWRTLGVSYSGSTENETKRAPRSRGSSFSRRAMRSDIRGQEAPQRVKMKSAIQGAPARSARRTVLPSRFVSVKSGTLPRTGGGSGRCSICQTAAPATASRAATRTPQSRPRRRLIRSLHTTPAHHPEVRGEGEEPESDQDRQRGHRPGDPLAQLRRRAVEGPAQGRHSIGQRIDPHQRREPDRSAREREDRSREQPEGDEE